MNHRRCLEALLAAAVLAGSVCGQIVGSPVNVPVAGPVAAVAVAPDTRPAWPNGGSTTAPATRPKTRPATRPASRPESRPATEEAFGDSSGAPGRMLLREGSYLIQTQGTVHRREPGGWWWFRIAREDPRESRRELAILPCTLLDSMQQIVESAGTGGQHEIVFDLTGQVFTYHGRNYLLPTHAPRVVGYTDADPVPARDEPEAESGDADSAQDILNDLQRAVGAMAQAPGDGRSPAPTSRPGTNRSVAEGTIVLWRRGRMVRDSGGAWLFLFEADASGLADPPMILLPCLLLERMERYAQRVAPEAPMLLNGRVYRYRDRNYVLPSVFQIPRQRTPLQP